MKRDYCLLMVDLQMPDIASAEMVRIFRIAKYMPIFSLYECPAYTRKDRAFSRRCSAKGSCISMCGMIIMS